jgi:hypothetical protein
MDDGGQSYEPHPFTGREKYSGNFDKESVWPFRESNQDFPVAHPTV